MFGLFLIPKCSLHTSHTKLLAANPLHPQGARRWFDRHSAALLRGRTEQYTEALPPSLVGTELTCINIGIICRNITKEADANGDVDESLYRGHIHLYATGKVENARGFNP